MLVILEGCCFLIGLMVLVCDVNLLGLIFKWVEVVFVGNMSDDGDLLVSVMFVSMLIECEWVVMYFVSEGLGNKEIGCRLLFSDNMVKFYFCNIFVKLNVMICIVVVSVVWQFGIFV